MAMSAAKVVRTMCPMNCHPTFCGMLVEVEGGKLKTVSGDKDNPDSQGFLCVRGRSTNEIFGNPGRLLYPQIRDDRRTKTWRRATWDEALDFIVKRMRAVGDATWSDDQLLLLERRGYACGWPTMVQGFLSWCGGRFFRGLNGGRPSLSTR
jgi:anaerobic selenocysteine-containing dehydrogenase